MTAGSLRALLGELAAKNGPLSVADYMQLALQHPEFGYYRHGDPLGATGDFITAPEVSQMFGEMIGLWSADVWRLSGAPESFALLELGPGHGTLMQDALRATAKIPGFHAGMKLHLLESCETLRAMQIEKLAAYKPQHLDEIAQLPPLPLFAIANEFFDALPVRQFEKSFQGWCERRVAVEDKNLVFTLQPLDPLLVQVIPDYLREAVPGTVVEISMPALTIMRELSRHIARHGGAMLIVDYGYAEASGKPSLQAVMGHHSVDVLSSPGEADLTAHVDFGALRRTALAQNLAVEGPAGQGEFLQSLGIELRADQLRLHAKLEQAQAIDAALKRLIDAAEMGVLFKAMAVTVRPIAELPGF